MATLNKFVIKTILPKAPLWATMDFLFVQFKGFNKFFVFCLSLFKGSFYGFRSFKKRKKNSMLDFEFG